MSYVQFRALEAEAIAIIEKQRAVLNLPKSRLSASAGLAPQGWTQMTVGGQRQKNLTLRQFTAAAQAVGLNPSETLAQAIQGVSP